MRLTDFAYVHAMFEKAAKFGGVDILVNNAGNEGTDASRVAPRQKPFWEQGTKNWDAFMGTNLYGVNQCVRVACRNDREKSTEIGHRDFRCGPRRRAANGVICGKGRRGGFMRAIFFCRVAKTAGRQSITSHGVAIGTTLTPAIAPRMQDEGARKRILKVYQIKRWASRRRGQHDMSQIRRVGNDHRAKHIGNGGDSFAM